MEHPDQPQQTPEESIFDAADFSMEGYDKHIRNARVILYIITGFQVLAIFMATKLEGPAMWVTIGVYAFLALVFLALALWTRQKPFTALLIALLVYVTLLVVDAIIEPADIIKGLVLKIVIICLLIMGLKNGREAQNLRDAAPPA